MPALPEWQESWGVWITHEETESLRHWLADVTQRIVRGETHTKDARDIPLADILEWYVEELEKREKDEARQP